MKQILKKSFLEWLVYFIFIILYIKFAVYWKNENMEDKVFFSMTIIYFFGLLELNRMIQKIK